MKNKLFTILISFTLFSCRDTEKVYPPIKQITKEGIITTNIGYDVLKIIKIRNEYVLWSSHNGSGVIIHCEDCINPNHLKK